MQRFLTVLLMLCLFSFPTLAETTSREITLPTDVPLGATIELPAGDSKNLPGIVLMHGSGPQDRDCTIPIGMIGIHPFRRLSQDLAERGFVVLRYDKRSYYAKKNNRMDLLPSLLPSTFIDDAVTACNTLAEQPEVEPARVYLVGHSQGGTFAPSVANKVKLKGVVMLAPGILGFQEQVKYQLNYQVKELEKQNTLGVLNSKIKQTKEVFAQYQQLFDKLENEKLADTEILGGATVKYYRQYQTISSRFLSDAASLKIPSLIINGTKDLKCPAELLKEHESKLTKNSKLTIVYRDGTAHELYQSRYTRFDSGVPEKIAQWVKSDT